MLPGRPVTQTDRLAGEWTRVSLLVIRAVYSSENQLTPFLSVCRVLQSQFSGSPET